MKVSSYFLFFGKNFSSFFADPLRSDRLPNITDSILVKWVPSFYIMEQHKAGLGLHELFHMSINEDDKATYTRYPTYTEATITQLHHNYTELTLAFKPTNRNCK